MTEEAYQKCPTIQEIVLISQFAQYVEIWQRDEQDGTRWHYRHYSPDEVVDLHSIAAHIAISEIYRGLNFAELNEEDE